MGTNNAALYNQELLVQAGINPAAIIPKRQLINDQVSMGFKPENKKILRLIDEADAVNRFTWYNLPHGLNAKLLERILYYKGQGMFFYMEANDKFYFLPYSLDGTIDVYGRFTSVTPLPFTGSTSDKKEQTPWIKGLTFEPIYDEEIVEITEDMFFKKCVLLKDYTEQLSQTIIPRQQINDPLLDVMADMLPFMRTALLKGAGVSGMRVNNPDEYANVAAAAQSLQVAALTGKPYVPIVGNVDFQELTSGSVAKAEEFLLALQSLDNYRLSTYGLDNGGLFQKRSHILEAEQAMNQGKASLVLQDSLSNRQEFCNLVNSLWGLDMWCEISETALGIDRNMDGQAADDGNNLQEANDNDVE